MAMASVVKSGEWSSQGTSFSPVAGVDGSREFLHSEVKRLQREIQENNLVCLDYTRRNERLAFENVNNQKLLNDIQNQAQKIQANIRQNREGHIDSVNELRQLKYRSDQVSADMQSIERQIQSNQDFIQERLEDTGRKEAQVKVVTKQIQKRRGGNDMIARFAQSDFAHSTSGGADGEQKNNQEKIQTDELKQTRETSPTLFVYAPALGVAFFKDILDLTFITSLPVIGFALTACFSLLIFLLLLLTRSNSKLIDSRFLIKFALVLIVASLVESIPILAFLPLETAVILLIYWMDKHLSEEQIDKITQGLALLKGKVSST